MTEVLTYEDGHTLVSVTDDVGEGENAAKRYQRSQKGWDKILTGLKKEVEAAARSLKDYLYLVRLIVIRQCDYAIGH